ASTALSAAGRSVQVGLDGSGKLTFTSGKFGSESNVSITSLEPGAASSLGLSVKTGTAGQDVAGTINGQAASGDGQVLYVNGGTDPASGLQVRITGGTTGNRGNINFIEGVGERTVNLVTRFLGVDGALENRTNSLNRDLQNVAKERAKLETRIQSYQERLKAQFSSADSLIAQLNSTRDYVSQQLAALAPQNSGN
ncbi:MAG: flagellar filament capping protein FliD, partial [Marinobacter sp.]|nr:flagellar filament capping protein FliD [Marinobacter sp.]